MKHLREYLTENAMWLLLATFTTFWFVAMLLKTGYISDDAYNSQVTGYLIENNISLFERTWNEIFGWTTRAGRFYPLAWYSGPLFHYSHSRILYKVLTVLVVLYDVAIFSQFVAQISKSKNLGILTFFVIPTFFQIRAWHDPLLAFNFLIPMICAYIFTSFYLFQKYLETGKKSYHGWSLFLYVLSLLSYEITYLLFPLFSLLAFWRGKNIKEALKASILYILVGFSFIGLVLLLKSKLNPYYVNSYSGVSISFNMPKVIRSFLIQVWATFPLSYYIRTKMHVRKLLDWFDFTVFIALFGVVFFFLQRTKEKVDTWLFGTFGFLLMTMPALLIAFSGHQEELTAVGYGFGYIPVYMQYFGLYLIWIGLFFKLRQQIQSKKFHILLNLSFCSFMAVSAYHNLGQNRTVVNDGMPFFRYSRDILETAIKGPLFQEVSEHFVILRKGRYPHDHGWFYQTHRLKPLQVVEPQEYLDLLSKTKTWPKKGLVKVDLSRDPVYGVTYSVDAEKGKAGVVYFAKLGEMTFDAESKKVHRLVAHQLKTFENETGELSEVELKNKALDFNQLFQNQDILPIHEKDFRISQYLVPNGQSSEAMQ